MRAGNDSGGTLLFNSLQVGECNLREEGVVNIKREWAFTRPIRPTLFSDCTTGSPTVESAWMRFCPAILLFITLCVSQGYSPIVRTITDTAGREIKGETWGLWKGVVTFVRHPDGKRFTIPLDTLSPADRDFINKRAHLLQFPPPAADFPKGTVSEPHPPVRVLRDTMDCRRPSRWSLLAMTTVRKANGWK